MLKSLAYRRLAYISLLAIDRERARAGFLKPEGESGLALEHSKVAEIFGP